MSSLPVPTTLLEAVRMFADEQTAHDYFVALRWPNGMACPRPGCGSADVAAIKGRRAWRCRECNRQFTAKVNTVFEDSPIGFSKWLPTLWMITGDRNGISSCEVARAIGVTQKTAWFMLHRLRLAMKTETFTKLSGSVEADETYIGPKARNRRGNLGHNVKTGKKPSGPSAGRTVVMGMVERGGRVRAFTIPNTRKATILPRIAEHVAPGATVYTDALGSYHDVSASYRHYVIDHAVKYVEGHVHTNSIENFWSVLKRTLGGTYICARPWHLDAYLDEQIFRFNERANADGPRFVSALKGADSRRVTYRMLIAKRHDSRRLNPETLS